MDILEILKIIAAASTALIGFLALIKPTAIYSFTGLKAEGQRGITEIRSIFGALFIALGVVPIVFGGVTYTFLGITYLAIAAVRLGSIFIDRSSENSNWISLASEVVLGLILVIGSPM
jgi:hypothetical protein